VDFCPAQTVVPAMHELYQEVFLGFIDGEERFANALDQNIQEIIILKLDFSV